MTRSEQMFSALDGKIEIDPMITHTMPLATSTGSDPMHEGESIKSAVVF